MSNESKHAASDIAIVGMAGRFPMARNVDEFWRNLREGKECISFFSDEELLADGATEAQLADENYVKAWGWMEDVDKFDAGFFDITPREAEITDPQIRLLLENAWECLEDAGCDPSRYPGRIGVFAGSSMMFYLWQNLVPTPGLLENLGFVQAWIVNDRDFVATRVNYKLDLKGPGITLQTACSTSLVAIHLGVQSLLTGESDMVLCGGVSAPTPYKGGYTYMEGGTFSPDGHVRTFDARAKGMLGGNGVALVALKRLEDAIADGDNIRAVIKGTALNNDGIEKVTYTAPSVDGQSQCILDALDVGDIDPRTIGYVEAHGTGTPLGDPIEIAALLQAWRTRHEGDLGRGWCPIGSVKTNIGHLDTAAGVAGVVKTVLAMEHREIPPSLHYERPNPEIDFESSPFFVNTALRPWERGETPRRASVSSLGMGGTNAHAILEEAPQLGPTSDSRSHQLLLLSARSEAALDQATANLADHLEAARPELADVAYTLQVGRKGFRCRRAVVAKDLADAVDALRTRDRKRVADGQALSGGRPVAFLFSGQGSQYAGMARDLYEREPLFREELDRCCELAAPHVGLDLCTLFFPTGDVEAADEELKKTQYTQPALFVVEYALARLLAGWGIEPDAMLGHSIGEYVAACLAGVLSLEDALALVAARGRLIGSLPEGGGMLAVHLSETEVRRMLGTELDLATVNAPELCVVSGPLPALEVLERTLESRGVSTRRLHTSHAFHSRLMDPILEAFEAEVRKVALNAPEAPVVSCTTGDWLEPEQATDPAYWVRHLREAVRFSDGVRTLTGDDRVLLEVGPGQALTSLAQLTTMEAAPGVPVVATTRHPRDESDDVAVLLQGLGKLWTAGVDVDWQGFHAAETRRKVVLPRYPFERQRYWIERPASPGGGLAVASAAARPVEQKNADMADWFHVPSWKRAAPAIPRRQACKRWLVLTDGSPLAQALVARVGETAEVFTARRGVEFAREGSSFTLDASDPDQYRRLIDAIAADGGEPTEIVHLWALGAPPDDTLDAEFYSLLHLAQALSGRRVDGGIRVDVVTSGLHDVLGERPEYPSKATVLGPCMTINLELAGIQARAIDLERDGEAIRLDLLMAELTAETEQPVLALQAGQRWALNYEPTRLPEARSGVGALKRGAPVLITGGLGGIGLVLAEELAREVEAKLVLVSRSGLPDRGAWDAWISEHGEDDRVVARIQSVRRLEELGAEVMVVAADSSDATEMRAVVDRAVERFGPIRGVIHAAGIAASGIVELKTRQQCEEVFSAKVRGTLALAEVFEGRPLDFALFCSSISSVCVGFGQVDYFAANAFMDAFAHVWRRDEPTHVVSVHWDAWSEVGMAVETEIPDAMKAERAASLRLGIGSEEGREAFRRILESGLREVVVSPRELADREDYRARFELRERVVEDEPAAEGSAPATAAAAPRPALSNELVPPSTETETEIAAMWADLLGIREVGVTDNFFELGGNSLVMMQVNVRLRSLYGVSLPIRELFEIPEVRLLAERMDSIRQVAEVPGVDDSEDVEEFTI